MKSNEAASGCLGVVGIVLFIVVWAKASFGVANQTAKNRFALKLWDA